MSLDLLRDFPRETSSFEADMAREGHIGISGPLGGAAELTPREQRRAELVRAGAQRALASGYITEATAAARGVKLGA